MMWSIHSFESKKFWSIVFHNKFVTIWEEYTWFHIFPLHYGCKINLTVVLKRMNSATKLKVKQSGKKSIVTNKRKFLIDPRGRPTVTVGSDHCFRSYRPSVLFKTKQISSENNVRYWQDCGSGRVDNWCHMSYSTTSLFLRFNTSTKHRLMLMIWWMTNE